MADTSPTNAKNMETGDSPQKNLNESGSVELKVEKEPGEGTSEEHPGKKEDVNGSSCQELDVVEVVSAISTSTVEHIADKPFETYKPPHPFPDEVVVIYNGTEFVDSQIALKVFQRLVLTEHKRAKDAYQFTIMDFSTLKIENLEEKCYDLLRLKVIKNAAGRRLGIRPYWLEREVKIPVGEFSQYASYKRKWSSVSRPESETPEHIQIKKEPDDEYFGQTSPSLSKSQRQEKVRRSLYPTVEQEPEHCSDLQFPDMAGGSSPALASCSKENVDMDSSAEQITSAGLMAMFGKAPPSKEKKQPTTKAAGVEKFEEMTVDISSPDYSMVAFKRIVDIKAKNVKRLMGRKLTNESSNVLMAQVGLAGRAVLSADISNDSFFVAVSKEMECSQENQTNLVKQLRSSMCDWLAVNRYVFAEDLLAEVIAARKLNFYGYLADLSEVGSKVDAYIVTLFCKYIKRRVDIYAGKEIWTSDEKKSQDIVIAVVEGNFFPTKVDEEAVEFWAREAIDLTSDEDDGEIKAGDHKVVDDEEDDDGVGEEEGEDENDANYEDLVKVDIKKTPSTAKVFTCNFCQKTYSSKQGLDSHKAGSHLGGIACPAVGCEQRYTSIKGLEKHIGRIHTTGAFHCNICSMTLNSYNALKLHKQEHDTKKRYPCRLECGRRFTRSGDRNKHEIGPCPKINVKKESNTPAKHDSSANLLMLSAAAEQASPLHSPTSPSGAKCSFCSETFENKSLMHKHISKMHKRMTEYVCDVCGGSMQSRAELLEHGKSHSLGRKYSKRNSCI